MYRPTPPFAPQQPDEDTIAYGFRALLFALEHDAPELLPADALRFADYAYPMIIGSNRDMLTPTRERFAELHARICKARRAIDAAETTTPPALETPGPTTDRSGGHRTPTEPPAPTRPPAPALMNF